MSKSWCVSAAADSETQSVRTSRAPCARDVLKVLQNMTARDSLDMLLSECPGLYEKLSEIDLLDDRKVEQQHVPGLSGVPVSEKGEVYRSIESLASVFPAPES